MSGCFYLADNTKICYTYDSLSRVTNRTIKNECDCVISSENFTYDAAGNITDAPNSCFIYDTNNRLITFNGNIVSYDMDGNMLSNGYINCEFDSGNRLISAGGHTYTYNAEDVRIRNLCADADTTYTYNTNCKLSQLLCKTTNGVTTKYVYGLGLIGEEKCGEFKTYHFDYRGSTVAITDECGNITDTFKYDAYGKLTSHSGSSFVIFGYNGRDGVVTDRNGLMYMRARYYSPNMRRFVNADVISGEISNAITLNRYAYANGNPVSYVDPFGLAAEERANANEHSAIITAEWEKFLDEYYAGKTTAEAIINDDVRKALYQSMRNAVLNAKRPNNIGKGTWAKQVAKDLDWIDNVLGSSSKLAKGIEAFGYVGVALDAGIGIYENIQNGVDARRVVTDAAVDVGVSVGGGWLAGLAGTGATALATKIGAATGTAIAPGVGTLIGAGVGVVAGVVIYGLTEVVEINGKSAVDWVKDGVDWIADGIASWFK